jgi:predicted DNA-binding ribbon-helix-helix protein
VAHCAKIAKEGMQIRGNTFMCDIYASTDTKLYEYITRSVRIGGVVTSIRLEQRFWQILEDIAKESQMTLPLFLTTLHDEVIERNGSISNFASLLRVVCTVHLDQK